MRPFFPTSLGTKGRHEGYRDEGKEGGRKGERGREREGGEKRGKEAGGLGQAPEHFHSGGVTPLSGGPRAPYPLGLAEERQAGDHGARISPNPDIRAGDAAGPARAQGPRS